MSLRYRKIKRYVGFKENRTEKYVLVPDRATPVGFEDLCKQIVLVSGINEVAVRGTLFGLAGAIKTFIEQGHTVNVFGIGSFIPTFSSKSSDVATEVNSDFIVRRKLRYLPEKSLRDVVNNMAISYDKADSVEDSIPTAPEEDEPVVQ